MTCKTCRWFAPEALTLYRGQPDNYARQREGEPSPPPCGQCRRYSPARDIPPFYADYFPVVTAAAWCGEYEAVAPEAEG